MLAPIHSSDENPFMARPKAFDEKQGLDAAIDCFWRNGLKSSSIRDLADEMGIAGPSLYNAYGCKRTLFVQALERYAEERTRARIARLERDLPPKQAILAFLRETIEHALTAPDGRGCLLVNTAMEAPPDDHELAALIWRYFGEIQSFFERSLIAAQSAGEIPQERNASETARLLLAVILGLRVLARTQPKRELLEGAVGPVLALLGMPSTSTKEVLR